jgi:hypothetical protein
MPVMAVTQVVDKKRIIGKRGLRRRRGTRGLTHHSFFKRLPGVGSKPGSSRFHLFSHFHHFTAEPQRLPLTHHSL